MAALPTNEKGPTVSKNIKILADGGAFILENYLSCEQQLTIYNECVELYKKETNMYSKYGSIEQIQTKKFHQGRYLLSFLFDIYKIPCFFNKLVSDIWIDLNNYITSLQNKNPNTKLHFPRKLPHAKITTSDSMNDKDENNVSNQWITGRLNCVLYPWNSKLGRHCDNHDGWVVLFSFGCTAEFFIHMLSNEDENNKPIVHEMKSGDIIIFEAGSDARVSHGVDKIISDTCPQFLQKHLSQGRIGLQLRQYMQTEIDCQMLKQCNPTQYNLICKKNNDNLKVENENKTKNQIQCIKNELLQVESNKQKLSSVNGNMNDEVKNFHVDSSQIDMTEEKAETANHCKDNNPIQPKQDVDAENSIAFEQALSKLFPSTEKNLNNTEFKPSVSNVNNNNNNNNNRNENNNEFVHLEMKEEIDKQNKPTPKESKKKKKSEINLINIGNGKLALAGCPSSDTLRIWKNEYGITHVVTLLREDENRCIKVKTACQKNDIINCHFGISGMKMKDGNKDYQSLINCINRVSQLLLTFNQENSVVIHCAAGMHRTGMAAYLSLRTLGYTKEKALEHILTMRTVTYEELVKFRRRENTTLVNKMEQLIVDMKIDLPKNSVNDSV